MNTTPSGGAVSRRSFLQQTGVATLALTAAAIATPIQARKPVFDTRWYRRALRWGQTNITEADPPQYDIQWWRSYWKETRVQGVIINAGGIFAYYPSKFPLHFRPAALGDRDLYGELAQAAHEDGLAVFARMDSNRAHEEFFQAHPDWFARDSKGEPYRAGERYITCINSAYYEEYIPAVMTEIIERSHPEGLTDNSWAGLGRGSICFCDNCQRRFREFSGEAIPKEKDWNSGVYRKWIQWNYRRRIEIWELNNRATRKAGGPDCIWSGMNSGSITGQSSSFRDYREICRRAEIIMLDHQSRSESAGFHQNAEMGKLIHGILGWDKLIPESMAMYQAGRPTFRVSSKPALEARLWMLEGIGGGIQPWWHHVGAYHEDRRMYRTAAEVTRWHEERQDYLVNREPVANVGMVWTQQNTDFYGRDNAEELVEQPWRGFSNALLKARIPWLPVHLDDLEAAAGKFRVVILPNIGAMSVDQLATIQKYVKNGGNLVVTGETSLCNEFGEPRPGFGLRELLGISPANKPPTEPGRGRVSLETAHSYLRLKPELRAKVYGPRSGKEPAPSGKRHPVLRGFDETDLLPFGGKLEPMDVDAGTEVLATFVPSFPIYPPETAWMREPSTDIPAVTARTLPSGARIVYFAADIDRRYSRDNLPDQQRLLENAVRWAGNDRFPLALAGPGLIDAHLYRQGERLVLHLVNLSTTGAWRAAADEMISVGPLEVAITPPAGMKVRKGRGLVSGKRLNVSRRKESIELTIPRLDLHELVVLES